MLSKIDLMHIYSLKDLQKMQRIGVSEKDLRQAYAILNEKKRRNAQSFIKGKLFSSLLFWMSSHGYTRMVRFLLDKGANVEVKNIIDRTPLHNAAKKGYSDIVNLLIERGADVNGKDFFGSTALHEASKEGHLGTVKVLLEKGANINAKDFLDISPLFQAFLEGHLEIIKFLLEKDVDVNAKLTPALLFWAVQENQMGVVKPLLEKGVNVNVKDKEGWTPLHMASWNEYSEMVKYLIEKGADVNAKTKKGWTAEDIAKLPKKKKVNLTREEVLFIKKQRSEKAKEIRSIDADAQGKAINHSLRRTLFGGKQIGHNAPMLKVVAIRLKEHQNNA